MARFEGTGAVAPEVASALGLVGVAARACGIERDVRRDHPTGFFRVAHIPVSVWHTGDVFARAYVRWLEIERSCAFVLEHLARLPSGAVRADGASLTPRLRPDQLCVSIVEGWRGEICHEAMTDASGRLCSYKVTDPSFHNWAGLSMALRDEAISDFPLCNKSFDLSCCGHDL
jgi:Ni,Fe-hydrogenase III large subunit